MAGCLLHHVIVALKSTQVPHQEVTRESKPVAKDRSRSAKLTGRGKLKIEKLRAYIPNAKEILGNYCRQVPLPTASFYVLIEVI